MRTGNVLFADGDLFAVLAYAVRIVTLPLAVIADWLAAPILRSIDRGGRSWSVVEVRFVGWDAEFVRLAEATSEADAKSRLAALRSGRDPGSTLRSSAAGSA